ncbi:MAG: hypothetical protein AAF939_13870 [Planctomycetota bacterium]
MKSTLSFFTSFWSAFLAVVLVPISVPAQIVFQTPSGEVIFIGTNLRDTFEVTSSCLPSGARIRYSSGDGVRHEQIFSGVTGIIADMGGGLSWKPDVFSIRGSDLHGSIEVFGRNRSGIELEIKGTSGNYPIIEGDVIFTGTPGPDYLTISESQIYGDVKADLARGADEVHIGVNELTHFNPIVTIQGDVDVSLGVGDNSFSAIGANMRSLNVYGKDGDDDVVLICGVDNGTNIVLNAGKSEVFVYQSTLLGLTRIDGGSGSTDAGYYEETIFGRVTLFTGFEAGDMRR